MSTSPVNVRLFREREEDKHPIQGKPQDGWTNGRWWSRDSERNGLSGSDYKWRLRWFLFSFCK